MRYLSHTLHNPPQAEQLWDWQGNFFALTMFLVSKRANHPGLWFVRKRFDRSPLLRSVVAIVAAYAIALSTLIVSFGVARAAVADATSGQIVICERAQLGNPAPGGDHGDLGNSCCTGCLILLAAVPPPPTASVAVERSAGRPLAPASIIDIRSEPQTRTHQSRAPPRSA
jgi:hypothetical protein